MSIGDSFYVARQRQRGFALVGLVFHKQWFRVSSVSIRNGYELMDTTCIRIGLLVLVSLSPTSGRSGPSKLLSLVHDPLIPSGTKLLLGVRFSFPLASFGVLTLPHLIWRYTLMFLQSSQVMLGL